MTESQVSSDDTKAYNALAEAVGQTLDRWSLIELETATTFQLISGIPNPTVAQAAMAAIISFEARLQVCAAIFRLSDKPAWLKAYWTNLQGRLIKKSKLRNTVAHFSIVKMTFDDGREEWKVVPYFSVGHLATAGVAKGTINTHSVQSMAELRELFSKLVDELKWLNFEVAPNRERRGANPKPEPDQVQRIRMEAAQTHEGKQAPPQP